MFDLERPYSPW